MVPLFDLSPASWLGSRRQRARGTVGYYVPDEPPVGLRILHRVIETQTRRSLRWGDVDEASILTSDPGASFNDVALPDISRGLERSFGELDDLQFMALISVLQSAVARGGSGSADVYAGVWVGTSARERTWEDKPVFDGAGRDCHLVRTDFSELLKARTGSQNSSLLPLSNPYCWWLSDQSAFVTTDIDLDSTFVATNGAYASAVEAAPQIDCLRVSRSSSVVG